MMCLTAKLKKKHDNESLHSPRGKVKAMSLILLAAGKTKKVKEDRIQICLHHLQTTVELTVLFPGDSLEFILFSVACSLTNSLKVKTHIETYILKSQSLSSIYMTPPLRVL